jgi:hypothetical protein
MTDSEGGRYRRNEGFFGADGQKAIARTPVAIVGAGGLGSHVIQQLGHLGARSFALIDHDHVTDSSLNRVVTADDADVAAATLKVDSARRRLLAINPTAQITNVPTKLDDPAAYDALRRVAVVFGCVDNDYARLELTRICSALAIPLIDLATDVDPKTTPMSFGGRVVCATGRGCLVCTGVLDLSALAQANMTDEQAAAHERIYGIRRTALERTGPMVVSVNGTVASLAITEYIALITGMRPVVRELTYYGHLNVLRRNGDEPPADCYYCAGLWGTDAANVPTR